MMKEFKEIKKGDSIYEVEINMLNQTVLVNEKIVKTVHDSGHLTFTDGTHMAYDNAHAYGEMMIFAGVMYFTNSWLAKRQVALEYRRMYQMTEMMIAKFNAELVQWGDNMRYWNENNK